MSARDDIAIAHDHWTIWGGAERVAARMARLLDAPIYTLIADPDAVPDDLEVIELLDGRLRRYFWNRGTLKTLQLAAYWSHVDALHDYDTVSLNKSGCLYYQSPPEQTLVRYVHSPPRYLWDLWTRRDRTLVDCLLSQGFRALREPQYTQVDRWLCNSDVVADRVRQYQVGDQGAVETLYPPVRTRDYDPGACETEDYLAVVSRLYRNKNVSLVVEAARQLDRPVRIAGDGPELERLRGLAPPNVELLGYISEAEKRKLLAGAAAKIMPAKHEDFGMTVVEAFASGTPVLAVDEGMPRHLVDEGWSGYSFRRNANALADAVRRFDRHGVQASPRDLAQFAEQFSARRFDRELGEHLEAARRENAVDVPWENRAEEWVAEDTLAVADGGGRDE